MENTIKINDKVIAYLDELEKEVNKLKNQRDNTWLEKCAYNKVLNLIKGEK